jgi:hypothetical protein
MSTRKVPIAICSFRHIPRIVFLGGSFSLFQQHHLFDLPKIAGLHGIEIKAGWHGAAVKAELMGAGFHRLIEQGSGFSAEMSYLDRDRPLFDLEGDMRFRIKGIGIILAERIFPAVALRSPARSQNR